MVIEDDTIEEMKFLLHVLICYPSYIVSLWILSSHYALNLGNVEIPEELYYSLHIQGIFKTGQHT